MRLYILFRRKQTLYFQFADSLYVVINLKNSVVKLTCGDYNGKYSEWKIMKNVILSVVFSLCVVYLHFNLKGPFGNWLPFHQRIEWTIFSIM